MQKPDEGRVVYLDVIRLLATFGVIVLHVYAAETVQPVRSVNFLNAAVGDSLVRWAVPLFVMISGTLFLNPAKQVSYTSLRKKYLPRLLMVYLFWWVVYIPVRFVQDYLSGRPLGVAVLEPSFHLWYLPMLMGVYLFIPVLKLVVVQERHVQVLLVLWAMYCTDSFLYAERIPQLGIFFPMNKVVGYVGYFLLGYYASSHTVSRRQAGWIYVAGLLGAVVTAAGTVGLSLYRGVIVTHFLNNLSPAVIAMSLALFVLCKQTAPRFERRVLPLVNYVRRDLFGIYLVHLLWIVVLWGSPVRSRLGLHPVVMPLVCVAIFFLSLYTTKLIRRIPGLRKMVE